jgi:hypothetical protein
LWAHRIDWDTSRIPRHCEERPLASPAGLELVHEPVFCFGQVWH